MAAMGDDRATDALGLAETYVFGTEPGRIPAVLHQAYAESTDDVERARLGASLARLWVYAGEPARARPFADAAVEHASASGDGVLLAEALDAALGTRWGPDELAARRDLVGRLDEVAAHLLDPAARTRAHIWALTVATETLDLAEMNRQIRALETLGEESPKTLFYAASRRLMLDLMRGRTDTVGTLVELAEKAQAEAALPDGYMVLGVMRAYGAAQSGDHVCASELAQIAEDVAVREGIRVVYAESAWIWLEGGQPARARALIGTFSPSVLAALPRDFNYLLTLQLVLDVALGCGADDLVREVYPLLSPYAGRAVVNSGAVMFHGVTDDPLCRAAALLGDAERAAVLRESALATYRRIGASWWRKRLEAALQDSRPTMSLRPGAAGVWLVGAQATPLPARRGFDHLHALLSAPGVEIHVNSLAGAAVEAASLGPVADAAAVASYRRRLTELDDELDSADLCGDAGAGARAQAERDALLAQLAAATGLGGRSRHQGGTTERTRVAVKKAISSAITAIEEIDPAMATHLREHVSTGTVCCYRPDTSVAWDLGA